MAVTDVGMPALHMGIRKAFRVNRKELFVTSLPVDRHVACLRPDVFCQFDLGLATSRQQGVDSLDTSLDQTELEAIH
jgi:hypothetical protein